MVSDKAAIIETICDGISSDDHAAVAAAIKRYPFAFKANAARSYTELQATRVFVRDGFVDRYSGTRLVHPAVLRVLSRLLASEFPFHANWKMTETHPAYWELTPTVDHIVPIARGGADAESNWATTSMLRNSAKANWTIEELGWRLYPPGDLSRWDGLTGWLMRFVEKEGIEGQDRYVACWYKAATKAIPCPPGGSG